MKEGYINHMNIPGLRGLGPWTVLKRSVKDFFDDKMMTYAAALAYQVLFAIFPFVIFLVALLGFLNLSDFFDWLLQQAQVVLPRTAMANVRQVIDEIRSQDQGGLLSFGIVAAIWVASSGVRATMDALNVAYDVEETRSAWKRYPLSIIYTLGLGAMIIAAAAMMLLGPQLIGWLAQQVGLGEAFTTVWSWLRLPVAVVLLTFAVALVYYAGPNVEQPFRLVTPGAVLAVVVWVVASLGFSYYVANLANYQAIYGSLGAVVVLLLYFYLSAAALLFGAEVNSIIDKLAPARSDRTERADHPTPAARSAAESRHRRAETADSKG